MSNEKYQLEYPNSHYLANINNLNRTNLLVLLNRLPTLGEILANKTKLPVDLYTFYLFMKDVEGKVDYLDFWFDLINHLNLCKHYVKGLRDSIVRQLTISNRHSGIPAGRQDDHVRHSIPILDKSKHKSLSSSILLDLILNDNVLEDNDLNRLSQFLRGDVNLSNLDPKLQEIIELYNREDQKPQGVDSPASVASYRFDEPRRRSAVEEHANKRVSLNSRLLDDSLLVENQLEFGQGNQAVFNSSLPKYVALLSAPNHQKRQLLVGPSLLERLIKDLTNTSVNQSFITRNNLKELSHNLLLKYFVEDSEKNLDLPHDLNAFVVKAIESDGRDDPDVFNNVKVHIFNKIENSHLPKFLNFIAIRNINRSAKIRIILGFVFLFFAFWIAYTLIFLDYKKALRAVVVVPFLIAFYCLVSSVYLIDPVLAALKISESFVYNKRFIRISEPFIHRLLIKRSLWVIFIILVLTACFAVLFSLVPGHRL